LASGQITQVVDAVQIGLMDHPNALKVSKVVRAVVVLPVVPVSVEDVLMGSA
jgi:hypothetical protein